MVWATELDQHQTREVFAWGLEFGGRDLLTLTSELRRALCCELLRLWKSELIWWTRYAGLERAVPALTVTSAITEVAAVRANQSGASKTYSKNPRTKAEQPWSIRDIGKSGIPIFSAYALLYCGLCSATMHRDPGSAANFYRANCEC